MPKALDDICVVDLTGVIAGPFTTTILADMGARVIKIELPGRGDDARFGYPAVEGVPFRLSESPGGLERLGPDLGEHNDEIFRGLLGLSETELGQLRADGVI